MTNSNAVVQAILAATRNPQIQAAMLMGSRMESSWNASAVGDNGTSFGPFQIHLPAHPGVSAAEAEDPTWAVQYMLPAYTAGVAAVPAGLWGSNPALAAATAAYHAERPAKMYSPSVYNADWAYVQQALGGNSSAVGSGSAGSGTAAAVTAGNVLGINLSSTLNSAYIGIVIMIGVGLMAVGLILLVRESVKSSGTTVNVKIPKTEGTNAAPRTEPRTRPPEPYRIANNPSRRAKDNPASGLASRPTRTVATRVQPTRRATSGKTSPRVVESPANRKAISA